MSPNSHTSTVQKSQQAKPLARNRVIVVLGMHRSGTSLITRGLAACGLELGTNLIGESPFNPRGHWEDRTIYEINEKIFSVCQTPWHDLNTMPDSFVTSPEAGPLLAEACDYVQATFGSCKQWAFKDPRTLRTLPFWRAVLSRCEMDISYVFTIRNPRSVASSLENFDRRLMTEKPCPHQAYSLWLSYLAPHFHQLLGEQIAIIDYDEFMQSPDVSLRKIAAILDLPITDKGAAIADFATHFVDDGLRHTQFDEVIDETTPYPEALSVDIYSLIKQHAIHQRLRMSDEAFTIAWKRMARSVFAYLRSKQYEEQLLHKIDCLNDEIRYLNEVKKSAEDWQLSLVNRWTHRWRPPRRPNPAG